MDLQDLIIAPDELDMAALLARCWSWLAPSACRPFLMNSFGDWFLTDPSGTIYCLDLLEGVLTSVAESETDFKKSLADQDWRDDWLLEGFVIAMHNAGKARPRGQCYGYAVHPITGGARASSNLALFPIPIWHLIASQILFRVKQLPPGTLIRGMECDESGEIRLVTE